MIVQLLRFALADDLELQWEPDRSSSLRFILDDPEYHIFAEAGGNGAWDYIAVPMTVIADYLFAHRQPEPRRNIVLKLSRADHRCLCIKMVIDGQMFMERTYSEHLFHAAFRLSGHAPPVNELFERLFDSNSASYKEAIRAMVRGKVSDEPSDPEYAEWQKVWADDAEERAKPEAKPTLVVPPEPSVPVPVPVSAKASAMPSGPFKLQQLRLYANVLASGKDLPNNMSEAGRNQVLAYYTQHRQAGSA